MSVRSHLRPHQRAADRRKAALRCVTGEVEAVCSRWVRFISKRFARPLVRRADALFNVAGIQVLAVERDESGRLQLTVETDDEIGGCPSCGVVAIGHGRPCAGGR